MVRRALPCIVIAAVAALSSAPAHGDLILLSDPNGLSAEAEFTLLEGNTVLEVRLRNTSTMIPAGFDNSDQILTAISWDFGPLGDTGVTITGGSVVTGLASFALNFDVDGIGAGADVSGEYGFGNIGGSGLLQNFLTATQAHATPFGGANLDGPVELSGPQGGLVSSAAALPLGGLGAIQDQIIATLTLSDAVAGLDEVLGHGVRVEFGSDAYFITTPGPGALPLLALAVVTLGRRRRREVASA